MARSVNVLYSRARVRRGDLNRPNFEQSLRAALATTVQGGPLSADASRRRYDDAADYGSIVMNHVNIMQQGVFIELVRFAPGTRIPLIRTGVSGAEYALQNSNTPNGTELARGFLYALILGDHFLYVSREIGMHYNEAFMEWIVSRQTKIASSDLSVRFTPEVNIEELPSVDRMVFRPKEPADAGRRHEGRTQPTAPVETRAASERMGGSGVFQILKAAQFTDERIAALEERGVDIEIRLEVFFKSDGSKYEISREDVADLVRDVPETELTLYSQAGREKSGRIKRVAYPAQVETVGDLYDRNSIAGALWGAFNYFNGQQYI